MRLAVNEPNDMAVVQTDAVDVQGTVEPAGAQVRVMGERADVSGGTFRAKVGLEPGPNVIDVIATARGRGTAMTAFRVTRELPVEVPDLDGLQVQEVEDKLSEAGLRAAGRRARRADRGAPARRARGLRAGPRARDRGAARHDRARRGLEELLT